MIEMVILTDSTATLSRTTDSIVPEFLSASNVLIIPKILEFRVFEAVDDKHLFHNDNLIILAKVL